MTTKTTATTTTFHNVTISIDATTPEDAYMRLCRALNKPGFEYDTKTYSTGTTRAEHEEERYTCELWPKG
jgi:hypothetical protein